MEFAKKISVIVLNYNGLQWLDRCFSSLAAQTIASEIEVIMTDNGSKDGSAEFAEKWLAEHRMGKVVQNNANLWYCEANNNGAAAACGKYVFFLNNDTWLEPDCLEKLYDEVERVGADAATPLVLDYDDDAFQNIGTPGLDVFGFTTHMGNPGETREIFAGCGCSLLVRKQMFDLVGGFDPKLLIYADETDIGWKVWIAGGKVVCVPSARLHHRGAAVVNPAGKTKTVESRTSDTKRFLANRNGILFLLKNSQHILLTLVFFHLLLLSAEALVILLLVRRWQHVRHAYIGAVLDVWRLRRHVCEWRRRIAGFRRRSDWWMLRFIRLKPSRWAEVRRLFQFGAPKIDAR